MISVPIVVSLGYFFGAQIGMVIQYLGGFERIIWLVVLCSVVFYLSRYFSRLPVGRYQQSVDQGGFKTVNGALRCAATLGILRLMQ